MGTDVVLSRFDGVRQTGPGRWIARCPALDDRRPSLSIRELEDGRVLLHCHAGCGVEKVLGAIGLGSDALYRPRSLDHRRLPERKPWRTLEVVAAPKGELVIVSVAPAAVCAGAPVRSDADRERVRAANVPVAGRSGA